MCWQRHMETDCNVAEREDVRHPNSCTTDNDVSTDDAAVQPQPPIEDSSPSPSASGSTTVPCHNPPRNRTLPDHYKL